MSYQHNLNNFTFTFSGWGKGKKDTQSKDIFKDNSCINWQILPNSEIGTVSPTIWVFGQDVLGLYKCKEYIIIANADGHSGTLPKMKEGTEFAYHSVDLAIQKISNQITNIKQNYMDKPKIEKMMNSIFLDIDNTLLYEKHTSSYNFGGSTLTVTVKFLHKNRLVSVTSNTGDSSLFKINQTPKELTKPLNCDTLEGYNIYVDKCNQTNTTPMPVFLARFNCPGSYKVDWVPGYKPIIPFKLVKNDNNYHAVENTEVMKQFYEDASLYFKENVFEKGGIQTIRDRQNNIDQMNKGKFPSTNFGNTAQGKCQCLPGSTIGDRSYKIKGTDIMITHTNVFVYSNKNHREIIGTDGFFDVLTDKDIIDSMDSDTTITKEQLITKMFEQTKKNEWNKPWDDVSMCVIYINYNKIKSKNKKKTKRENRKKRRKLRKK